jgi:hypothetical protein
MAGDTRSVEVDLVNVYSGKEYSYAVDEFGKFRFVGALSDEETCRRTGADSERRA